LSGCRSRNKSITTADGRDLQVQGSMFWVPAFVDDLEVRFMAAHDTDQNVCLVLFAEVSTETALSIPNCFHILTLLYPTAFKNHSSMSFVVCKLRLI
jgi:hypothetical protein